MRRAFLLLFAIALTSGSARAVHAEEALWTLPGRVSPLALERHTITGNVGTEVGKSPFTAERASILLRSLTVPGWGEATAGRHTAAAVFGTIELGIWTSFVAFRTQESMRRHSYENTASLHAGIDLDHRDEEFRRVVGSYLSSDEYNQLVVFRDAANLYLGDPRNPDYDGYHAYIAEHSLKGRDTWDWASVDDLLRYRIQRKDTQHAGIRANTALALAVINRLISAVNAARVHSVPSAPHSWNFEMKPTDPADASAFQLGVRTHF